MTDTITIGGREFRVGATYAPLKPDSEDQPRTLIAHSERHVWHQPRGGIPHKTSKYRWLRWAGDEVAP